MKIFSVLYCILFLLLSSLSVAGRKRRRMEIKYRGPTDLKEMERLAAERPFPGTNNPISTDQTEPEAAKLSKREVENVPLNREIIPSGTPDKSCPVKKDAGKNAIWSFWNNDLATAFACAAQVLENRKDDGLSAAILYYLTQGKHAVYGLPHKIEPPASEASALTNWEVLGPFPVGKLEVDGDPSFDDINDGEDFMLHLLALPSNTTKFSELVSGGAVTWKAFSAKRGGNEVEVHFPVHWNELGQGLSTPAVFEFQGWARTNTYVRANGLYTVHCTGTHTVYLRNDNATRLLIGDVYHSYIVSAVVDLRIGPVGVLLPLRGQAQASISCSIKPTSEGASLTVYPPMHLPNLLLLSPSLSPQLAKFNGNKNIHEDGSTPMGLMVSSVFSVVMQNTQGHPLSVDLQLEQPKGLKSRFSVRQALPWSRSHLASSATDLLSRVPSGAEATIVVAPGQTLLLPVELIVDQAETHSFNQRRRKSYTNKDAQVFLPCKKGTVFTLVLMPSRGTVVRVPFELTCRRYNESFLVSFLDHDKAVSQAAVLLPLELSPEETFIENRKSMFGYTVGAVSSQIQDRNAGKVIKSATHREECPVGMTGAACSALIERRSRGEARRISIDPEGEDVSDEDDYGPYEEEFVQQQELAGGHGIAELDAVDEAELELLAPTYPTLLTLHGTGLTATSQADAYKMMPLGSKDYLFGVEGYFIVAPTRHGAHNWENVGEFTARHSVDVIRLLLSQFPFLPQISRNPGILAGHSMGGHGAWMAAVNSPDSSRCLLPAAGWIRKEEYSTANAFFSLDVQNSFVDPGLKQVLELAMSEFHVDKLISNLAYQEVYLRVGSQDSATHPWYTRRMYRLLKNRGVNVTLEETPGKNHWWWDTVKENDGGALNDEKMRSFYKKCLIAYRNSPEVREEVRLLTDKERESSSTAVESTASGPDLSQFDSPFDPNDHHNNHNSKVNQLKKLLQEQAVEAAKTTSTDQYNLLLLQSKQRCRGNFTLSVLNPSSQRGMCGLQVLQQFHSQKMSTVDVSCEIVRDDESSGSGNYSKRTCSLFTNNVRRLRVDFGEGLAMDGQERGVDVDGSYIPINADSRDDHPYAYSEESTVNEQLKENARGYRHKRILPSQTIIHICWSREEEENLESTFTSSRRPKACVNAVNPLMERSLFASGPVRQVYSRPFYVVYGTPQDQSLRVAIRDLALYLGNAHLSSHHSQVRVLSDLEYRAGRYSLDADLANLLLIGGPNENRITKRLLWDEQQSWEEALSSGGGSIPVVAKSTIKFYPFVEHQHCVDCEEEHSPIRFSIGRHHFSGDDDAVIATFPIARFRTDEGSSDIETRPLADIMYSKVLAQFVEVHSTGLAACLYAPSDKGYLAISRLAWSVVPPMVRAPFANYIPDFMVFSSDIWKDGFGAVKLAGYWNSTWDVDETQTYFD